MAYIVISHRDEELGRQNLTSSMTVGRSPECDISWHDILLSRKHCRVEFFRGSWSLVDLTSKNGTFVNGLPINGRRVLKNSDEITIGRIKIVFRSGVVGAGGRRKVRPADPWEAMEGTVSAFELDDTPGDLNPVQRDGRPRPTPRPAPQTPRGYEREGVGRLVRDMLSDEHDSAAQERRAPDRVRPAPIVRRTAAPPAAQTHNIEPESHSAQSLVRQALEAEARPIEAAPKRPRAPVPAAPILRQLAPAAEPAPKTVGDAEARLRALVAESARVQSNNANISDLHPAESERHTTAQDDLYPSPAEHRQAVAEPPNTGTSEMAGTLEELAAFESKAAVASSAPSLEPVIQQDPPVSMAPPVPAVAPATDYHGLLAAPSETTSSTVKDDVTTISATAPTDLPLQLVEEDARLAPVVELPIPTAIEEATMKESPLVVASGNEQAVAEWLAEPGPPASEIVEPMKGLRGVEVGVDVVEEAQERASSETPQAVDSMVAADGGHVSSAEYVDLYLTRDEAEADAGTAAPDKEEVRLTETAQEKSFTPADVESLAAEALGLPKHSAVVVTQSPIMEAGMSMIEAESAVVDDGEMMSPENLTRSLDVPVAAPEGMDEAALAALKQSIETPIVRDIVPSREASAIGAQADKVAADENRSVSGSGAAQSLAELSAAAAAATPFPSEDELAPPRKRRIISLRPKFMRPKGDASGNGAVKRPARDDAAPENGEAAATPMNARAVEPSVAPTPVIEPPVVEEPIVEQPVAEQPVVEQPQVKKPRVVELKPRKLSAKGTDVPAPSPASAGRKIEAKAEAVKPVDEEAPIAKKPRVVELKPRKLGSKPQAPVAKAEQSSGETLRWPWQARREQEGKAAGQGADQRAPRSAQLDAAGVAVEDEEVSVSSTQRKPTAPAAELNTRIVESKVRQVEMKPGKIGARSSAAVGKVTPVEVRARSGDPRLQTADALLQKLLQLSPDASTRRFGGATTEEGRAVDFWLIAAMVVGSVLIYFACSTVF